MSRYAVLVDDNFHFMDEDERYQLGTFETAEAAVAACKKIVDDFLSGTFQPGMTSDELCAAYRQYGEDPFILSGDPNGERIKFSAWNYAEERSKEIASSSSSKPPESS